nr:transglutaminase domain-containing protein [Actinacidiphila bryophytorum]
MENRGAAAQVAALRRAHRWISREVRPVYSVVETRPVSQVLRLGRGSCSQRMAVLETVARASGVPTRVRGLVVDGSFWYPRFPRLRRLVPAQVVLAWPEFHVADDELIELRREIHRRPELAGEERGTAGLEVVTGVGGHGILAVLDGSADGPTVAYRADMDLGVADAASGMNGAPHTPDFAADERAIGHGVRAMAALLTDRLAPR